jgi:hypothetical protein
MAVSGTVSGWRMALGCVGFFGDVFHRGEVKGRRPLTSLSGKKGGLDTSEEGGSESIKNRCRGGRSGWQSSSHAHSTDPKIELSLAA